MSREILLNVHLADGRSTIESTVTGIAEDLIFQQVRDLVADSPDVEGERLAIEHISVEVFEEE